jgi:hypothetical protein
MAKCKTQTVLVPHKLAKHKFCAKMPNVIYIIENAKSYKNAQVKTAKFKKKKIKKKN